MGNINNSNKSFLQDWVQLEKQGAPGTFTNTWIQKKGHRKIQMIEYPLHVSSEEDIEQQRKLFWLRLNHPQLVSSMYFLDESQNEFCSSNYKGKIFIERIPLTLQTVTDIPFPDALHIYRQSLIGFYILTHDIVKFCFPISEEHIGINCEAVCKVWMNSKFEKNFPSRNQKIHQHVMVRMIFQTIEENVDLTTIEKIPSPMTYVYQTSRSPSEVRFDEAMTLFENYIKEFFKGQCPAKLSCVDRVGGVYNLSKNWKNHYDSLETAVRNNDPQLIMKSSVQQQQPTNTVNSNPNTSGNPMQFNLTNGYTTFRREEPVTQNASGHDTNRDTILASTPKFNRTIEGSYFSGSNVQFPASSQQVSSQQPPIPVQRIPTQSIVVPPQPMIVQQFQPQPVLMQKVSTQSSQVQFPQGRVIQQIVYQNPSAVPPQIVNTFSQKQLVGSIVRMPVIDNGMVNNVPISQRSEVKESFIQTKVINKQVENIPQTGVIQQQSKEEKLVQQIPSQVIQQTLLQKVIPQGSVVQQLPIQGQNLLPPPSFIQKFPKAQSGFVRPKISFGPQKIIVPSQQLQSEVTVLQQTETPKLQVIQPPAQQIIAPSQTQYQVTKTTSVYATPQNITKVEVQRIQANDTIIQTQHEQMYKIEVEGENNLNVRLRNDQQSISSINPQTIQVPSNEQISDKFSTMKQQPMDTSTRNFYTNMMDGDNNTQKPQQTSDYFSSYYANYTSKLYETNNQQAVYQAQNPLTTKLATKKEQTQTATGNNYKYNVTIDDGMSSADFLSSLKNIKTTTSPFLKSQINYDYGLTTYDGKGTTSKFTYDSNKDELYKFDYKNYITKVSDGVNVQNDLNIVGQKLNIVPAQKIVSAQQKPQYNINYEHQQGQNEAGNLKYESQRMQVSGNDGSYAEQYSQTANYRSIFDKYATYDNYQSQIPISLQKSDFKLGENLKTQFSRNNTQEQQYGQMTKNTVNNTSSYSPMHQHIEHEEYQVDYDPQILADLQKLKGSN